jgi:perosamine synthetase
LQGGGQLRDEVIRQMQEEGISLNLHYRPLHRHRAYQRWAEGKKFPVADAAYERVITLPIWPEMEAETVQIISESLLRAIKGAKEKTNPSQIP